MYYLENLDNTFAGSDIVGMFLSMHQNAYILMLSANIFVLKYTRLFSGKPQLHNPFFCTDAIPEDNPAHHFS